MTDCIFCKIARGDVPAQIVFQDEQVIPNRHIESAAALGAAEGPLLAAMLEAAQRIAQQDGVASSGYRLVFNVGADAGMSVPHLHLHLLGGRRLQWPPG
jgi:histidine triad (HIT) family protein